MLCVSIKILLHDSVKNTTETVKGFKFCTFIGRFSDITAMKWLMSREKRKENEFFPLFFLVAGSSVVINPFTAMMSFENDT